MMKREIILYGCSKQGLVEYNYLLKFLPDTQFKFCATEKTQDIYEGIPVISLRDLYSMDREKTEVYVYDDSESLYEKKERLELAGFKQIYPCTPGLEKFYDIIWRIPNIKPELADFFEEIYVFIYCQERQVRLRREHNRLNILSKMMRISDAYNILEDEESRDIFRDILRYRISGKTEFLKRRVVFPQYFRDEIFKFSDHEIFVDGGAAQGDSIINFMNHVDNKYDKIYAFEAKKSYCIGMEELFREKNIELINKGLYSHDGTLYFYENQHGSFISETMETDVKIDVTSIDSSIHDAVTFIKMDIEGSELKALEGAKNVIQQYTPKLAICVYHLPDDLWEVPLKIKELVPEYKVYMRHHYEEMDEETVCYATI